MNYIGKFISNFKEFYNEINSATLTGAIDVIIIKQPDGTYLCSPFHVRFGKIGVLRSREKIVDIEVNGNPVDIHMKLGESGEAFFVEEVEDEHEIPQYLATSPLPSVTDIETELRKLKLEQRGGFEQRNTELPTINYEDVEHKGITDLNNVRSSQYNISGNNSQDLSDDPNDKEVAALTQQDRSSDETHMNELTVPGCPRSDTPDEYKTKRKKRKKSTNKKPSRSREISIPRCSPSCSPSTRRERTPTDHVNKANTNASNVDKNAQEDIFHMDDDYAGSDEDEGYACDNHGLSRSISLPVNSDRRVFNEWPARKVSSTFTGEFHPFSDGDVTPQSSPTGSRPPSPKSDTEYETQKQEALNEDPGAPSWGWGQLPNMPKTSSSQQISRSETNGAINNVDGSKAVDATDAEKRSMLGGMLNFMRTAKKIRQMPPPEKEGIYLDSLQADSLDPQVTALYFSTYGAAPSRVEKECSLKDEDTESGTGPSLPHSPHSVRGAIGGPGSIDSDIEDGHFLYSCYSDVAMSLCGGLSDTDTELSEERFMNSLVTYDEFTEKPGLLMNVNLVVRLDGKYYNWQTAAPMLLSTIAFRRILPEKTTNQLINEHMPKKKKPKSSYSWWSWRRSEAQSKPEDAAAQSQALDTPLSENSEGREILPLDSPTCDTNAADISIGGDSPSTLDATVKEETSKEPTDQVVNSYKESNMAIEAKILLETCVKDTILKLNIEQNMEEQENSLNSVKQNCQTPKSEHCIIDITKDNEGNGPEPDEEMRITFTQASSNASSASSSPIKIRNSVKLKDELAVPSSPESITVSPKSTEDDPNSPFKEKYKKSLRLTSAQIEILNLNKGANEFVFSVTTAYQGTTRCKCDIYVWDCDDKIVISDIDGTITRSDVLGHLLPMVGKDWAQWGVADLFTKVKNNGYHFLYLSARAIGQARTTREYLRSIRQGQLCLPDGPLLLSPTSLISALHREVIERRPEEFKISCLKDIQTLFPSVMGNPFYAGFGNKINDTWAYCAVGVPITRIFTINHRGEVRLELSPTFQSSYTRLSDQVDHMFPPLSHNQQVNGHLAPSFTANEEFSYFTYWREPIPALPENCDVTIVR